MRSTSRADHATGDPLALEVPAPVPARTRVVRRVRLVILAATLGYLVWLVRTNWSDLDRAVLRIGSASWQWLAAGVLIELSAQVAGGLLLRRLLAGAGHHLTARSAVKLSMAQNAVGLVVPGGPLAGGAFAFRHLRRQGLDAAATTWVLAGANVVSTLAMVALGIVVATGVDVASIVLLVAFGLIGLFLAGVARRPTLIRGPARVAIRAVAAVRRRSADDLDERVEGVVVRLGAVRLSNRDWLFVCLFAGVAVVADCAALICCTRALIRLPARCASGAVASRLARQCARFRQPTLTRVLLVYLAGQATLSLPLIPGGLGPVEAAMTVTFIAGQIRAVPALSAVLLYRLLSYWSVLLVGMVCWSRLRRQPPPSTT